jgi:hypothetical protein
MKTLQYNLSFKEGDINPFTLKKFFYIHKKLPIYNKKLLLLLAKYSISMLESHYMDISEVSLF